MRTHNTPRLSAGPQTAGTPIKFWNVASIGDDEGEITLYGDVVSRQPVDWWTGEPEPGLYIAPESFMEDLAACLLYTSPSPRDRQKSRMPSSA